MYKTLFIVLFFFGIIMSGQEALHNYGNLKIHNEGAIGFHHDFVNDGTTDDNQGTVGFFSDDTMYILGAFRPVFKDMEIMVTNGLYLDVGVSVTNNTNFILGNIITPRNYTDINLNYTEETFYSGQANDRKIDGISSLTNKHNFTFPIGYDDQFRPLTINSLELISSAKSAYFHESPNNPTTYSGNYDVSQKVHDIVNISPYEFWYLDGSAPSWVDLQWNENSSVSDYVNDIKNLIIVGWHIENKMWHNLGGLKINGDLNTGKISSEIFTPNEYSIITFGNSFNTVVVDLGNFILTPNADGRNDFLEIDEIERSPNNELKIFNRWGRLVYSKTNYSNTFDGKANVKMVVKQNDKLPDGVYFYIINLTDINLDYQGYLYLIN